MVTELKRSLVWYRGIIFHLISISPVRFFLDAGINFISNVLQLLILLLPIKAIVMLSGGKLPSFFNALPYKGSLQDWMIIITSAIAICYCFVVLFKQYLSYSRKIIVKKFVRENKIPGWSDFNILYSAYERLTQSTSSIIYLLFSFLGLYFLYTSFFIFSLTLIALFFAGTAVLARYSKSIRNKIAEKPREFSQAASVPLFLVAFCFVLIDIVSFKADIGVLVALLSLILYRQSLANIGANFASVFWFLEKSDILHQFFYFDHKKKIPTLPSVSSIWDFLSENNLRNFLSTVAQMSHIPLGVVDKVIWRDPTVPFIYTLIVSSEDCQAPQDTVYIFKIYDKNRVSLSKRDQFLYEEFSSANVMPRFVANVELEGRQIHVLSLPGPVASEGNSNAEELLLHRILSHTFSDDFIETYRSESPIIWDRIESDAFASRLQGAYGVTRSPSLKHFLGVYRDVARDLYDLPVRLHSPLVFTSNAQISNLEDTKLAMLGDWVIEPIGAALPTNVKQKEAYVRAVRESGCCSGIDSWEKKLELCSLFGQIELNTRLGKVTSAICCVEKLMDQLESLPNQLDSLEEYTLTE